MAGTAAPSVGRKSPQQVAKAAFDGRNGCQKCFCVTFGESNKALRRIRRWLLPGKGERRAERALGQDTVETIVQKEKKLEEVQRMQKKRQERKIERGER